MKEIWNEICHDLSECKNKIVWCLGYLGWEKYLVEITIQYPIQVGHKTKLDDIVVFSNGTEQLVIEVKRPGHTISPEDEKQMFSYTRLLNNHVLFGIHIGDDIRPYYDDT